MRIARIATGNGPRHAVQDGDRWHEIEDPFADRLTVNGISHPVRTATLLAPVEPRVVVGMAHNGSPSERQRPPQMFLKSARTVIGPGEMIVMNHDATALQIETELAVVIRSTCRNLTAAEVPGAILGFTIGNDVTAVDQIPLDNLMTQAKNGNGFTPIGPWIETQLNPDAVPMTVQVNGRLVATADTSQLARNVTEQLIYVTSHLTLGSGDILLTGCPGTFAPVTTGDVGSVSIQGIGTLNNPIN